MTVDPETGTEDISVIRVSGHLDFVTARELEHAIVASMRAGNYNIIIDLKDVDYVSGVGWSVFLDKLKDSRENGGDLKLTQMSPRVFEVFKSLEFEWTLNSYQTLEEAASAFPVKKNIHKAAFC